MPLAFGAHAGALLALTGSPSTCSSSDAADEAGVGRFGFFEFALAGIPLLIGTVVITVLIGDRVLPHRNAEHRWRPTSATLAATLAVDYDVEDDELFSRYEGVAELVIPPRSGLIGQAVFPGMITESGDLVIVAVQRDGQHLEPGEIVLAAGDAVLVRGTWEALATHLAADDDVLVVDDPDQVRRQVVPLGLGAKEALGVLAAMVRAPRHRRGARRRRRAAGGRGPRPAQRDHRSTTPSGRCRGPRSCWWAA